MAKGGNKITKITKDEATLADGTKIFYKNRDKDLLKEYFENNYDLLTEGSTDNKSALSGFMKANWKAIQEAGKNPDTALSAYREVCKMAMETDAYFKASNSQDVEFSEYLLDKQLFTWQKDLLQDQAKSFALLCGRRSGKSFAGAAMAVNHCLRGYDTVVDATTGKSTNKKRSVAIIGLTIGKAQDVFWENLKMFIEICKIPVAKIDSSNLRITFANGSYIKLLGNSSKPDREKIRGDDWSLIIIDEAQSQQQLDYVLTDLLGSIIDGRNSTVVLMGTGSLTGYGKWADITTGEESPRYRHYKATMADNPTIPNRDVILKQVRDKYGWDENNITYRREYLGENVIDTTRVIFPIRHYYTEIPKDFIAVKAVVGVDYGFSDYNAFAPVVIDNKGKAYLVNEKKFNNSAVSEIVATAKFVEEELMAQFKLTRNQILFVADNSDQSISQEIYRNGIKITNAYKQDLKYQISLLQEKIANGTVEIQKGCFTDKEMDQAVWQYDEEKKSVIYEVDDDYYHPDIIHALRYAVNYLASLKKI